MDGNCCHVTAASQSPLFQTDGTGKAQEYHKDKLIDINDKEADKLLDSWHN